MKRYRNASLLKNEVWRQVRDFPNYFVSSKARIFFIKKRGAQISQITKTGKCGYVYVFLQRNGVKKRFRLHRLVLMAFTNKWDTYEYCCHVNDIKSDNRLENLYWGTPAENSKDGVRNNKYLGGQDHPCSKLKKEDVLYIYKNYKRTAYHKSNAHEIAKKLNVKREMVTSIYSGKFWHKLHAEHFQTTTRLQKLRDGI